MASRLETPLVHTLHGPFTADTAAFYARHGHKAALVGISRAQLASAPPALGVASARSRIRSICMPGRLGAQGRLRAVGWPDDRRKGPHRAIAAAHAVDVRLVLAGGYSTRATGVLRPRGRPALDGDACRFVGEVGGPAKRSLFARARGLLMPIRWDEPFGMVMVEALACGTPVLAFPEGAARELVIDGEDRVPCR